MTTAAEILKALACSDPSCNCRTALKAGKGDTHCPAHDDNDPSLSVSQAGKGVLVHCHAGCEQPTVIAELKQRGLWSSGPRQEVAHYDYRDPDGTLRYQVVKYADEPRFLQRRPDGKGGWTWDMKGVERLLFRLPELRAADKNAPVLIPEGEKDVETLREWGYTATCNSGGAGKFRPDFAPEFEGRPVVILPDQDDPGEKHARQVFEIVSRRAAEVRVLSVPSGKDITEWKEQGHSQQEVQQLLDTAPVVPKIQSNTEGSNGGVFESSETSLNLRRASEVVPKKVEWLQYGRDAFGKVTLIYSNPGDGKSLIGVDKVARATTGRAWPDGEPNTVGPINALMLSAEDDPEDTVVPRLIAAGADLHRVFIQMLGDDDDHVSIPDDVPKLEAAIKGNSIRFLVIDTLYDYLGMKHDSHRMQDVRQGLRPLIGMARRTGCCVLVISHPNKQQGQAAIYRAAGSLAVIAYSRLSFVVGRDQDDEELRILAPVKVNIAKLTPSLSYKVVPWTGDPEVPVIEWQGAVQATADQVLADPQQKTDKTLTDRAATLLGELLRDGPVDVVEATKEVMHTIGCSRTTVHYAAKKMRLRDKKKGFKEGWQWDLPFRETIRFILKIQAKHEDAMSQDIEPSVAPLNLRQSQADGELDRWSDDGGAVE